MSLQSLFSIPQFKQLKEWLLSPPPDTSEEKKPEVFVLYILLIGTILLTGIASLVTWYGEFFLRTSNTSYFPETSLQLSATFIFFVACFYIAKKGFINTASYLFLSIYLLMTVIGSLRWGATLPTPLLTYAVLVVMTGILLGSRVAFVFTSALSLFLTILIYLQANNLIPVNISWRQNLPHLGNSVVLSMLFFTLAVVTWLYNRERAQALRRALRSEQALQKQNDELEHIIDTRTKELHQAQVDKMSQLYHFSAVGRSLSSLVHDISSPLTVVSINLQHIAEKGIKDQTNLKELQIALDRAIRGTRNIEEFVQAARKQIQNQHVKHNFAIHTIIDQVVLILEHKAREFGVKITVDCDRRLQAYGNPLRFSQVLANLVSNAIDAYEHLEKKNDRQILITVKKKSAKTIEIRVEDFGIGIKKEHLESIFDPLFTTKGVRRGIGLGLSIVREIVEKEMAGKISVKSTFGSGTVFTVRLPKSVDQTPTQPKKTPRKKRGA